MKIKKCTRRRNATIYVGRVAWQYIFSVKFTHTTNTGWISARKRRHKMYVLRIQIQNQMQIAQMHTQSDTERRGSSQRNT